MPRGKRCKSLHFSTSPSPSRAVTPPDLVFDPPQVAGDFSVSPLVLPPAPVAAADLELDRILFDE
jgi:hypothetical protein